MKTYTIKKVNGTPDWSKIPVLQIDTLLWTDSIDITAWAQLCWDEEGLFVRMEAIEPNIRMEETGPQACTCNDSCMEFFFSPTDRKDYFNIELNPTCAVWIGIGTGGDISDLIRLQISKFNEKFSTNVEFTEKGWVLTYKVPFAFIKRFFNDFEAKEGKKIRANMYKCGDRTVKPHWMSWNEIETDHPSFHCPEFFGEMTFGGE